MVNDRITNADCAFLTLLFVCFVFFVFLLFHGSSSRFIYIWFPINSCALFYVFMFKVMFTSKAEGFQILLVYFWQGTSDIWFALVPCTEEAAINSGH